MAQKDSRIDAVLAAVRAKEGRLTQDEAAGIACLSKSRFRSLFHASLGTGFRTYSQEVKMDRAKALLADENNSLEDVTGKLGYEAQAAFAHSFKKFFGLSPAKFRKTVTRSIDTEAFDHLVCVP